MHSKVSFGGEFPFSSTTHNFLISASLRNALGRARGRLCAQVLHRMELRIKGNFLRNVVIVDVVNIRVLGETKLGRKEIDDFVSAV